MAPVAAGVAVGTAALTVGRGVVGAVSNGLSFAGELLRAATGSGSSPPSTPPPTGDPLQASKDDMQQRVAQQLAQAGIQLLQPVELTSNGQGGIAVVGPHPQQAAIEEALGSDVLLERDFNQLSGNYEELAASGGTNGEPAQFTLTVPPAS